MHYEDSLPEIFCSKSVRFLPYRGANLQFRGFIPLTLFIRVVVTVKCEVVH
jgi:hypothetical protein